VVTRPVKAHTFAQNVSVERETLSLCVYELDALQIFELGDPNPKLGRGGVELGENMVPFESVFWFLLAPNSDQSAISNRFNATPERYRQTDGQTTLQ
jgi:hypothetical protein